MSGSTPIETPRPLDFFKDNSNRWRTKSLFVEFADEPDKYPPLFTVADEDREIDGQTYLSAKRKYLEYMDPTEFTFAEAVFGSYSCWEAVCGSPFVKPHIDQWRKELDIKIRALGVATVAKAALGGDVNAGKWLAEGRYRDGSSAPKRGRPSKAEVLRRTMEEVKTQRLHDDALERMRRPS